MATTEDDMWLPDVLTATGMLPSKSEARRRIQSGAAYVDGERVSDLQHRLGAGTSYLLKVGKRNMARVTVRREG